LQQGYNGDRLRVKKVDNGTATYYLRSSVLGGQVMAEVDWQGTWQRGYVYLGGQLLVIQSEGVPKWVHADPVTKSQRLTDYNLNLVAAVDLDPWGGETSKSLEQGKQPHRYTSYERDGNGNDQAMNRQYHSYWQRFDQPDPYDGSVNLTDPQSLNRYSYVQNDPVNFVDPLGLMMENPDYPSRPDPLDGNGFMSPGIKFFSGWTQNTSPSISSSDISVIYPARPFNLISFIGAGGIGGGGGRIIETGGRTPEKSVDEKRRERQHCIENAWDQHVNRVLNKFGGGTGYVAKLFAFDKLPEDILESIGEVGILKAGVAGAGVIRRGASVSWRHYIPNAMKKVSGPGTFVGALMVNQTISKYQNLHDVSKVMIPSLKQFNRERNNCLNR
jgi:RHS repeat-associated protein